MSIPEEESSQENDTLYSSSKNGFNDKKLMSLNLEPSQHGASHASLFASHFPRSASTHRVSTHLS